jgi:signal transduction histidine kinase
MTRTQRQKVAHYTLPSGAGFHSILDLELVVERDFLQHRMEKLPGLVWTTDSDLRITWAMGSGLEQWHLSPHQIVGQTLADFLGTNDAGCSALRAHRSALAGQTVSWEYSREPLFLYGLAEPFRDVHGNLLGTITSALDIGLRKKKEEERLKTERQIQDAHKVRSLKTLAGGVAHKFNNLLTAVLGYATLAQLELPADSPVRTRLREIERAAQGAADLARQMLLYAQKTKKESAAVDLSELIRLQWPLLQLAAGKKIVLLQDLAHDLPPLEGDRRQLSQLILVLLHNAVEAIGEGTGTIRVRTQLVHGDRLFFSQTDENLPEGDYVWLQVSDTGMGMDEETRTWIFEPFFSTKFTGRGLGMAAAQGIVHGHEGAISVSSKPGLGSTIHVFLPVAKKGATNGLS